VARNGQRFRQKIGDIALRPGDTLLLEADPALVDRLRNSRDFFLVSRVAGFALPRYERAPLALSILLAMVVAAGLGWLSMVNAAMLAAGLMVLGRCCTPAAARQSVHWPVLMVAAAALGVGAAMRKTGAADAVARLLVGAAGSSPWLTLAVVYAATMLFAEVMSHFTAVVMVFPIALSTAAALGRTPCRT
jgi:di/tricarboxylate transporter